MCVPYAPVQIRVPECEIDPQRSEPVATETDRLTAKCTNHPKSFVWINCTSNSGVCEANSNVAGPVTYTVVATNEVGNSAPATRALEWQARPPRCGIAISSGVPSVGIPYTLYESCDGNATAFFWTNCEPKGETCIANASSPGPQTYTLYAANVWGTGAPSTLTVTWQAVTPICTVTSTFVSASVATLKATCDGKPTSYQWSNCTSTTDTCTASSSASGPITYTVRGVNAFGAGSPASVTVEWSPSKPMCTIVANTLSPITGGELILTANCSGNPYNYLWYACSVIPGTNTCRDIAIAADTRTYTVIATNLAGTSEPVSLTLTWQTGLVAPVCDLHGTSTEFVGTPVTLIAFCTGNPTSYEWTGCASTTSTCTTTSALAVNVTYTVRASNAAGTSQPKSTTIAWTSFVPACTLSVDNPKPQVGLAVQLTASCSNSPTTYAWSHCAANREICVVSSAVAGIVSFTMSATNAYGTSPVATIQVNWVP